MSVGCIRPSYLVLLGIAVATLLFYAAYISTSPFVVRLPTPRSHHQHHQQQQQQYNESLVVMETSDTLQNHSDAAAASSAAAAAAAVASSESPQKNATKHNNSANTAVSAAASPAVQQQQLTNTTLSASDAISMGIIAQSMYESGHLDVNQNICSDLGNTLQLLIMVTSAPSHSEARMAVRQTWGHYGTRRDVSIAFMLGSTKNATLNAELNTEEYMYGDIIRGKFVDTYDNLTLKTISMLEWVDNYCPNVAFILKTDDDMFINVSKLLSFINKHKRSERVIYGRLAKKWKPIRNKRSKYYISTQQFKPGVFPDFTTGPAYLIPSCVVHDLYLAALNHTYVKLEDVFITGIVANYINVKRVHVNEFLNKRIPFNPCNIQKGISIHMVKYSEQFDLWKKLLDGRSKCK